MTATAAQTRVAKHSDSVSVAANAASPSPGPPDRRLSNRLRIGPSCRSPCFCSVHPVDKRNSHKSRDWIVEE